MLSHVLQCGCRQNWYICSHRQIEPVFKQWSLRYQGHGGYIWYSGQHERKQDTHGADGGKGNSQELEVKRF